MTSDVSLSLIPLLLLSAQDPAPAGLSYRIERVSEPELHVLVRLDAPGDPEGETELRVQPHWGGVSAGGEDLAELRVTVDGEEVAVERRAPNRWHATHAPDARLAVTYRLPANAHQATTDPAVHRRPIVNDVLFHAYGELALVMPAHLDGETRMRHGLEWVGFEEAACSFFVGPGPQRFQATVDQLRHAVYLAGDLELVPREIGGHDVWLAADDRGWGFELEEFADLVATVVEVERGFFDDFERPYYLVSMIPVGEPRPGSMSSGGTGLTDSFSLALQPGFDLAPGGVGHAQIARLLAHELFHDWNGIQLRLGPPEQLGYWFSEGFTDFYARRMQLRGGLIGPEDYVASLNESLRKLYTSPVREAPNARILSDFWKSEDVKDLPYRRGDVVALILDHGIRAHTGGARSLDDLMRELVRRGRTGWKLDTDALLELVAEQTSPELAAALRAVVVDGALPAVPADVCAPCLALEMRELGAYDIGFDVRRSVARREVRGVREGGPAHVAGLRDGQTLRGWSYRTGDATTPVNFQIEVDGAVETIEYVPAGELLPVPQLALTGDGDCDML